MSLEKIGSIQTSLKADTRRHESRYEKLTFKGFSENQKQWVNEILETIGFSLAYLHTVELKKNKPMLEGTAGRYVKGKLIIYQSTIEAMAAENPGQAENIFKHVLPSIIVHELAHAQSAYITHSNSRKNPHWLESLQIGQSSKDFGESIFTKDEAELFSKKIEKISEQSLKTRLYFSPYHVMNVQMYKNADVRQVLTNLGVNVERFLGSKLNSELEAILVQLYFEDPKKLLQVEESQRLKLPAQELADYISPTAFVEELLMHTTKRSLAEVRASQTAYKQFTYNNSFPTR